MSYKEDFLRPARYDELDRINEIRDKLNLPPVSNGDIFGDGLSTLVALKSVEVIGYLTLQLPESSNQPHDAEVKQLFISPEDQGKGFGTKLLQLAEQIATRQTCASQLTLQVSVRYPRAMKCYETFGFVYTNKNDLGAHMAKPIHRPSEGQ